MKQTEVIKKIISIIVGLFLVGIAIFFLFKKEDPAQDNPSKVIKADNAVEELLIEKQLESSKELTERTNKDSVKEGAFVSSSLHEYEDKSYWLTDEEIKSLTGKDFSSSNKETSLYDESAKASSMAQNLYVDGLEVHYIDVGQGDCTLIRCGDKAMLIDAGDNDQGTKIQRYLKEQGVLNIDYLISTHGDADHSGGLDVITTKFDIDNILVCAQRKGTKTEEDFYDAIRYKGYRYSSPSLNDSFRLGDAICVIVGPVDYSAEDINDSSIIVKVIYGTTSFMFMGDAGYEEEDAIMAAGVDLSADVLKVGHHGSSTSTSENFVNIVNPKSAVVSCLKGNEHGHPHKKVLNILKERGIDVYRTDEQGTIVASSDGSCIYWNVLPSTSYKTGWDYQF